MSNQADRLFARVSISILLVALSGCKPLQDVICKNQSSVVDSDGDIHKSSDSVTSNLLETELRTKAIATLKPEPNTSAGGKIIKSDEQLLTTGKIEQSIDGFLFLSVKVKRSGLEGWVDTRALVKLKPTVTSSQSGGSSTPISF